MYASLMHAATDVGWAALWTRRRRGVILPQTARIRSIIGLVADRAALSLLKRNHFRLEFNIFSYRANVKFQMKTGLSGKLFLHASKF